MPPRARKAAKAAMAPSGRKSQRSQGDTPPDAPPAKKFKAATGDAPPTYGMIVWRGTVLTTTLKTVTVDSDINFHMRPAHSSINQVPLRMVRVVLLKGSFTDLELKDFAAGINSSEVDEVAKAVKWMNPMDHHTHHVGCYGEVVCTNITETEFVPFVTGGLPRGATMISNEQEFDFIKNMVTLAKSPHHENYREALDLMTIWRQRRGFD